MDYGVICPCIAVKNLAASRKFYESIGMEVIDEMTVDGLRVVLKSGYFRLALMTFLSENSLNFRGADVFATHNRASERLPGLSGQPVRRRPDDENGEGESWATHDPDGNHIFLDTNPTDLGAADRESRIAEILTATERQLEVHGASEDCLQAFRDGVLSKYGRV
ncbi:MAG: VOC family protein [bacterium]|nr:VOC family protein [bacterium]